MKKSLLLLAIISTLNSFGQTATEYFQSGIAKHEQQDFKGAVKEYDKAIKLDQTNKNAFFNRGTCALAMTDFKAAMTDFTKAIELDQNYANAYYSRATVYVSQQKYKEALPDLDKTIELDPKVPNALTLRGQIRAQTGNKIGACEDFQQAKQIGEKQADKYLSQFCGNEKQAVESLILEWPKSENWKIGTNQENDQMTMVEFIHSNETLEKWTEFGTMIAIKGVKNVAMDKAMNMTFDQAKLNSPKAKLTFIEKDESAEYPWIIFTIECPNFKNDKTPESQLWYVVQGKTSLYTNFRAVKKATIPAELKDKWTVFFKTAKITSE